MAKGPGKYDDLTTYVREQADATVAIVIVGGGTHGDGFSIQALDPSCLVSVPAILRMMADEIERDMRGTPS